MMQLIHRPMVFHIHSNLLIRLTVQNRKRRPDLNFILHSSSQERTDHADLLVGASEVMVENREERNRVDSHILWDPTVWWHKEIC